MVLTLSQVQAWSTEHLIEAATYWSKTADQWEDVFLQMRNQSHTLVWEGAGGDALRQRTGADLAIVSTKADELRQASKIARDGAGTIGIAQRRVLHAVEDAHNAGFTVGEDFSVTDIRTSRSSAEQAARQAQAQAQALATDIRQRAVEPLPPPAPGRLPPLTPGEMATPRLPAPPPQPPNPHLLCAHTYGATSPSRRPHCGRPGTARIHPTPRSTAAQPPRATCAGQRRATGLR